MTVLLAVTGLRGSGKTTLVRRIGMLAGHRVIRPVTTRPPREGELDYTFTAEDQWDDFKFAWQLQVGSHRYGVTWQELESAGMGVSVVAFSPNDLGLLKSIREAGYDVLVIGLDTLPDVKTQFARVRDDQTRTDSSREFDRLRTIVNEQSDIVLRGDEETIYQAGFAVSRIAFGTGSLVLGESIKALAKAGALLDSPDYEQIQAASYDLRIGDEIWSGGQSRVLDEREPFQIPAYSYAIVKAQELVRMPRFLSGRFDLKLSLFFRGAILSNGPQVDPGYTGALFCLIFNASDHPLALQRGDHFSTLEFSKVIGSAQYSGDHNELTSLSEFMGAEYILRTGGTIEKRLDKKFKETKSLAYQFGITALSLVIAFLAFAAPMVFDVISRANNLLDDARNCRVAETVPTVSAICSSDVKSSQYLNGVGVRSDPEKDVPKNPAGEDEMAPSS